MWGAESQGVQARRPCDPLVLMCDDVHAVSPAGAPTPGPLPWPRSPRSALGSRFVGTPDGFIGHPRGYQVD